MDPIIGRYYLPIKGPGLFNVREWVGKNFKIKFFSSDPVSLYNDATWFPSPSLSNPQVLLCLNFKSFLYPAFLQLYIACYLPLLCVESIIGNNKSYPHILRPELSSSSKEISHLVSRKGESFSNHEIYHEAHKSL